MTEFTEELPVVLDHNLSYLFPLRPDLTITISNIPRDLRKGEVDLITQFLEALVIVDQPVP